ncbi:caspase family protein [Bradyrhizobium sp. LA2.1]|uniref:caspase family protein n=1 Tax=Bradyrhizobium sp. LA2.1 TaxID=3156376 RepID=UPI0033950606
MTDRNATTANLNSAFASLARLESLQLFLLYLSGHGELDHASGGWFCLPDAQFGQPSLTGAMLRELIGKIPSDHIVVLIDCCHAEAVATGIGLPSDLNDRKGQLIIASARANQRAWEDDDLRRSLFSDVVLRCLSVGSPIADLAGGVDLETKLLPYLREQVPLEAAARKAGEAQEPVSGGWMAQPLKLTTVEGRSLGRSLSTAEAIRSGVRRGLIGIVAGLIASLVIIEAFVIHVAVTPTGTIVVRPGLSSTFGILPSHFSTEIDTGLHLSDLDTKNAEVFVKLANGTMREIRTHSDSQGLKTWLEDVMPELKSFRRKSMSVLARGTLTKFMPDEDPAPIEEAEFLATLRGEPITDIAYKLYNRSFSVFDSCSEASRSYDFTILAAPSEVSIRDMRWLTKTAPSDSKRLAMRIYNVVQLSAYRATHSSERRASFIGRTDIAEEQYVMAREVDTERIAATLTEHSSEADDKVKEFRAFVGAISALSRLGDRSEIYSSMPTPLNFPKNTWCDLHAKFARAILADKVESAAAEDEFRIMLGPPSTDVSKPPTSDAHIAVAALGQLASVRPLSSSTLDTLASIIEAENDLTSITPARTLLDKIAAEQLLSDRLRNKLFEDLRSPDGQRDSIGAVRILASNMRFLSQEQQTEVIDWLRSHSEENRTMSDIQEALGLVSKVRPIDLPRISLLEEQLPRASLFALPPSNYRGEIVLTASGETAAVALGRIGQTSVLSENTLSRLKNLAIARKDLVGREEILKALAAHWYGTGVNVPAKAFERLTEAEASQDWRSLEIDVAAIMILSRPPAERVVSLNALVDLWAKETEPALRIGLARLIAAASVAGRIGPPVVAH